MSRSHGDNRPPSPAQAQFAQALALHRAGDLDAAERAYRAILKSQHRHFDAAHLLGLLLLGRGEAEAAEAQIARALKFAGDARNHNVAEAHNNRGLAQVALRRFAGALASFEAAAAVQPGHADAAANLAGALYELGRVEDALAASDRALALQPRQAEADNTRGKALRDLRRFDESLAGFDRAIALRPDYHDAFYNRGLTHLLLGDFAKGWPDAEHRWHTADYAGGQALAFSATREGLKGRRVLVLAEQGVGDEIMFASILPDLARDAAQVTLECDPRLMGLFARSFAGVALVPRRTPPAYDAAAFDAVIPAGSLGRLYRKDAADFPAMPFLTPDPQIIEGWKARLTPLGDGLKIGISWRGGTDRTRRGARSIPLEDWAPLLSLPDARCVSLQYGDVADEIARANRGLARPIVNFEPAEIDDFDRLAGLVSALDLVVTVQTTLVHLCGAIGKPCRVFVPYIPEWRYGTRGGGMAWYGTVALYRQAVPGRWDETMARVISDLKGESRHAG